MSTKTRTAAQATRQKPLSDRVIDSMTDLVLLAELDAGLRGDPRVRAAKRVLAELILRKK